MTSSFAVLGALLLAWASGSEAYGPICRNCSPAVDQHVESSKLWKNFHAFVPFLGTWGDQAATQVPASRRRRLSQGGDPVNATGNATLIATASSAKKKFVGVSAAVKGNFTMAMAKTAEKLATATDDENVRPPHPPTHTHGQASKCT